MPDTIEERLRKLRAQKSGQSIEERLAALRAQRPPEPPGMLENIGIGLERGYRKHIEPAMHSIVEATESGAGALKMAEEAGRGIISALFPSQPASMRAAAEAAYARGGLQRPPASLDFNPVAAIGRTQEAPIAALQQAREARYQLSPTGQISAKRLAELNARAALDPSKVGKGIRGTTEVLTAAGPTLATAIATRGAILPTSIAAGIQSAGQPAQIGPNVAAGMLPIPGVKMATNAVRRALGKGAAQVIEAEAQAATAPARQAIPEVAPAVGEVAPSIPAPPTAPANPLQSAFAKLETDSVEQIGEMIANANRRLNKERTVPGGKKTPITAEERQSSWDDYNRLNQLRPEEQRALSQVLPARNYEPVLETGKSRGISDIPAGQPNAQLDANLRELEGFFGAQRGPAATTAPDIAGWMTGMARTPTSPVSLSEIRAQLPGLSKQQFDDEVLKLAEQGQIALHRNDAPGLLSEAERQNMVKVGNDYYTAATVRGPRVSEAAAFEVKPPVAPAGRVPAPPGDIPTGFGGAAPQGQQQLFDAAARSPWQDTTLAYFRANLLTNPISRALDLGQTIINQFADAAVRPVAAAVDVIVSKLAGKRAITGPSLRGTGQAFGSIRQGLRDVREVLRTGKQAIDSGADDVLYGSEIRSGLGKGLDVPVNGVFRLLGAFDAPFRRFGYARNLFDRARVAAINEMKRGKIPRDQLTARIRELMDRPDIIKAAVRDGERTVFSESNKVSAWVAKQTQNSPNARLAVGIIQPFMRIPLNAAMKAADFAGVGGVKALYKVARGLGRKAKGRDFFSNLEEQRVFAQNVAAGSFAPAAFLLGMELEQRGKLEGFYYTGGKDYPNGKAPTSINIGGKNYDVNRLGGFIFAPLFVGATYNRLRKKDVGKANALLRSFGGLTQQVPGLGYYGAPAKTGRILTSDKPGAQIAKEAGETASGFIPASGLVRATAKTFGLLPQKTSGSAIVDASLERNQPLFAELQKRGKRIAELRKKEGEKDDAFNARVQQFSANYTRFGQELLNSPRFQAAPDNIKALALDRLNERAKHITSREFAFPEIELDANFLMDAAEQSKKNPANK